MFFKSRNNKVLSAFGVKIPLEKSKLVIIPVPWQATASYGLGAGGGPELIRQASSQLDFFHKDSLKSYNQVISFKAPQSHIKKLNRKAQRVVKKIQDHWKENKILNPKEQKLAEEVNVLCKEMLDWLFTEVEQVYSQGKIPVVLGGDHSVSEGILRATSQQYQGDYGVVHIDAHHDLRVAYQGFKHSHASVMYNVMTQISNPPKKLLQIGIRDFCKQEYDFAQNEPCITCYYDEDIFSRLFSGESWADLCKEMVSQLPQKIYFTLDVDGLCWQYAPGTGTPVPGGLSFNQVLFLLKEIKKQNKKIIAFDVVETAGSQQSLGEWNGNVSARLLYHLAILALSQ